MRVRARLLLAAVICSAFVSACSTTPSDQVDLPPTNPFKHNDEGPGGPKSRLSEAEAKLKANQLYRVARNQLQSGEYGPAIKSYDTLIAKFPFTEYATQGEIDKIYAQFRNYQGSEALTAADRFLREHPRHPEAPYVQYLKGLINQGDSESIFEYLPLSSAGHDVGSKEQAFEDFALLLQRYPNSDYAADARQRMISLRNRIADHNLSIARFYLGRGAYLAAAKRAENIIARYPGAPATVKALQMLKTCYAELGLPDQEKQVDALLKANQASVEALNAQISGTNTAADSRTSAPPPPRLAAASTAGGKAERP